MLKRLIVIVVLVLKLAILIHWNHFSNVMCIKEPVIE